MKFVALEALKDSWIQVVPDPRTSSYFVRTRMGNEIGMVHASLRPLEFLACISDLVDQWMFAAWGTRP